MLNPPLLDPELQHQKLDFLSPAWVRRVDCLLRDRGPVMPPEGPTRLDIGVVGPPRGAVSGLRFGLVDSCLRVAVRPSVLDLVPSVEMSYSLVREIWLEGATEVAVEAFGRGVIAANAPWELLLFWCAHAMPDADAGDGAAAAKAFRQAVHGFTDFH